MREYERSSTRMARDELDELRRVHEREIEDLIDRMRVENEMDDGERRTGEAAVRRAAGGGCGKGGGDGGESGMAEGGGGGGVDATSMDGGEEADARGSGGDGDGKCDPEMPNGGIKVGGADGGGRVSAIAQKEEELKKILDEMTYLNKTKSEMIWLLKQVITAETKLKR
ncbi:hypothetical protein ACHAXA_000029 [Cyclostephanos tholiformis]|uniref:Uncharacterized protein n=1 Tax=Cyclostephanos tholiformis TaxID=382380 RepID=A0ABD3SR98_9STRA